MKPRIIEGGNGGCELFLDMEKLGIFRLEDITGVAPMERGLTNHPELRVYFGGSYQCIAAKDEASRDGLYTTIRAMLLDPYKFATRE